MTNTIELLEAIGRDASLRHASGEDLSRALSGLKATEALKLAAIAGDDRYLAQELGDRDVKTTNNVNNNVGGGNDFDDDDSDGKDDEDMGKSE